MRSLYDEFGPIGGTIVLLMMASAAYVVLIGLPRCFYVQAKCLERGYPKYEVTVFLKGYCMKLDGATYSVVDAQ